MGTNGILGIVIVVVGVVLLLFGLNASDAPMEKVTETVTGRYSDKTMWYLIGGIAAIVGGGLIAFLGRR